MTAAPAPPGVPPQGGPQSPQQPATNPPVQMVDTPHAPPAGAVSGPHTGATVAAPGPRGSALTVENAGPTRYGGAPPGGPAMPQPSQGPPSMQTNPQFFVDQKRGELHELRLLLRQLPTERDTNRQREILKKVIAYMTVGMDVSRLFSEMVMLSSTTDMVQKKMVYLYLTNYAETNPSLSILAVNAFQKDCGDHDPRLRGLAIRSLCSLRVPDMVEYIEPALRRGLSDPHPYVRRVCVMGLLKLRLLLADRPQLQEEAETDDSLYSHKGIVAALQKALYDPDPQVTVNAIHALNEVDAAAGGVLVTQELITSLLNRIKQFNEWGQCGVLNLLMSYEPETEQERFDILNILDDRLKSSSAAVVLSCTRCFLALAKHNETLLSQALARLAPPLLTLVATSCAELSYTVLQHILLILETAGGAGFTRVLEAEYQQFFCRYSDPSYIKSVKLEILTSITTEANVTQVLQELKDCVSDANVSVGRHIIKCMGRIALQVPSSVNEVVDLVLSLMEHEVDFVMCASFAVIRDILRKHRQVIDRVADSVERYGLKVSGADLASVLWIVGEFGASIGEAPYLLEVVGNRFVEEEPAVQLELLTACTKLFFVRPGEMQPILGAVLKQALGEHVNFDVRDRALFVYRLIRADIETAASLEVSAALFAEFNTLSVVYRQPSSAFLCVEPLPFCGRPVKLQQVKPLTPKAIGGLLDTGTSASISQAETETETVHATNCKAAVGVGAPRGQESQQANEEPDLLDFPTGTHPPLRLRPREPLSAADFQRLWEGASAVNRSVGVGPATSPELFAEDAEAVSQEAGIYTMASGVLEGNILKMFLYATDDTSLVYLCELVLCPNPSSLQLQVRTSPRHEPHRAGEFMDLLLQLLTSKQLIQLLEKNAS